MDWCTRSAELLALRVHGESNRFDVACVHVGVRGAPDLGYTSVRTLYLGLGYTSPLQPATSPFRGGSPQAPPEAKARRRRENF
eukprot:3272485-Prymnesium_polylepis.1